MSEYINIFKKLFEQMNLNKVIEYISILKSEIRNFYKFLVDYLNKNFFPKYRKFPHFLEKEHYRKFESTNNKLENYNNITIHRYGKKTYRTNRVLWSALIHKKDVWIENCKMEYST
jgi:hypothetical protein